MKFISTTAIALAAMLQVANANFDVYNQGIGGNGISGNTWGWQVYTSDPSCDDVHAWIWRDSSDVSGGKYGVRCKGDGCAAENDADPSDINEIEFNFNSDDFHFTAYKNRDWGLYDLDDNKIGTCMPFPDNNFYCGKGLGQANGIRKLRCLTNSITAEDINAHKPS
ncbi:hypothetical protein F4801DRAFT_546080 [Xylaria longipes]|nr:hypothetical protein F4801DRAFT_546080 [Xylaria longipes]RYC63322.1 hypothetical protein CHU98_g2907 [Xylaria longipes]